MAVLEGFFLVTIQETDVKEKAMAALTRARRLDRPILVSVVNKVDSIDPLLFFQSGGEHYLGERFFWKDPSDEIVLVGMGIAKQIQSDQATDRFFHVEKVWQDFLAESITYNPFTENGIGPLLFGGFSFDPLKQKTELWSKFSDAQFYVPKFMLSIIKGQTFITTNIVCTNHDDISLFQLAVKEIQELLSLAAQGLDLESAKHVDTNGYFPAKVEGNC